MMTTIEPLISGEALCGHHDKLFKYLFPLNPFHDPPYYFTLLRLPFKDRLFGTFGSRFQLYSTYGLGTVNISATSIKYQGRFYDSESEVKSNKGHR